MHPPDGQVRSGRPPGVSVTGKAGGNNCQLLDAWLCQSPSACRGCSHCTTKSRTIRSVYSSQICLSSFSLPPFRGVIGPLLFTVIDESNSGNSGSWRMKAEILLRSKSARKKE